MNSDNSTESYNSEQTEFRQILDENSKYWSKFTCHKNDRWVLFDALCSWRSAEIIDYPMKNLIPAICLSRLYSLNLMAFASPGHKRLQSALSSFGTQHFIDYISIPSNPLTDNQNVEIDRLIALMTETSYKNHLRAFEIDGIRIGDLVYDSLLKQEIVSTPPFDINLIRNYITIGCRFFNYWWDVLSAWNIDVVILGHTVQWRGIIGRIAATKGITVYGVTGRGGLRKYKEPQELDNFPNFIERDLFQKVYASNKNKIISTGKRLIEQQTGQAKHRGKPQNLYHGSHVYGDDFVTLNRSELCEALEFDETKPIVLIASHVFNDVPNCYWDRLYPDYYEWLADTIYICSQNTGVNWLIKEHPQVGEETRSYNVDKTADKLVRRECFELTNIKMMPANINNVSLIQSCHAIITVSGTIALEMSCYGIPAILAGRSDYSECGFTLNPKTVQEYKSLVDDVASLNPLSEERRALAHAAYAFLHHYSKVPSRLLCGGNHDIAITDLNERHKQDYRFLDDDAYFNALKDLESRHGRRLLRNWDMVVP